MECKRNWSLQAQALLQSDNEIVTHYVTDIVQWFDSWRVYSIKFKANPSIYHHTAMVKSEALMDDSVYELRFYSSVVLVKKEAANV